MRNGIKTTEFLSRTLKGKENILKDVTVNFNIHLETPKPQNGFEITHRKWSMKKLKSRNKQNSHCGYMSFENIKTSISWKRYKSSATNDTKTEQSLVLAFQNELLLIIAR